MNGSWKGYIKINDDVDDDDDDEEEDNKVKYSKTLIKTKHTQCTCKIYVHVCLWVFWIMCTCIYVLSMCFGVRVCVCLKYVNEWVYMSMYNYKDVCLYVCTCFSSQICVYWDIWFFAWSRTCVYGWVGSFLKNGILH